MGTPERQGVAAMAMLKKIMGDRRFHRLAWGLLLLGAGTGLLAWKQGVDGAMLKAGWHQAEIFLMERPWWLFAGLVILPGLPIPTSALLILAGTVWRERPLTACAVCLVALALNMTWTYWVAARPGRVLVEKLLTATAMRMPDLPQGNHLRMILIMRLTPGLPLFLQNYVLGFFRVPFRMYLPVSMGCSGLIASGIVLSAAGVADGNLTTLLTGVPLIVLGWVVVQMIRQRLGRKVESGKLEVKS